MQAYWTVMMFVFGSIIGSFLNVCIYRLPRDKSPWSPSRSYCPQCHELIQWYDNIPLVSYFLLHGHCRRCGSHISSRYLLVEFLTAILFAVAYWVLSGRGESVGVIAVYLAIIAWLIVGSFIDLELRIIPDELTIGAMLLAPVLSVLLPALHQGTALGRSYLFTNDHLMGPLAASLVGMAVGAGAIYFAGVGGKLLFRKEAMGFGDVKFMAALGGLLGWKPVLLVFFMAPVFGSVIGLIHLLRTKEHHIPYGPFLSAATVVTMLWGDRIFEIVGITPLLQ